MTEAMTLYVGDLKMLTVFKIFNLCGPDPPTDRRAQYGALHYSA